MLIEKAIELVPENEIKLPVRYLPHRPVVKEIGTTRIQIVFDTLVKQKGSHILNDCFESEINLILSI